MALDVHIQGGSEQYRGSSFILVDLITKALIANGLTAAVNEIKSAHAKTLNFDQILVLLRKHANFH